VILVNISENKLEKEETISETAKVTLNGETEEKFPLTSRTRSGSPQGVLVKCRKVKRSRHKY
jgi:hypothetical protein